MKRKKDKFIKIILIFVSIILILIAFRNYNNYKNKHTIIKLVNDNLDLLNESIENNNYDKVYELERIKDKREYPLDNNELYIEFFCKGYGFASNSIYTGFYYISNDKPTGFQGDSHKFETKGKGWKWEQSGRDNWEYTEKIDDNWYYYEAGF